MKSDIVISAHQPNFLPYLGFFDKMNKSDFFIIRDEVLYKKKEYHNRNLIRKNSHDNINFPKSSWISVPVRDPHDYFLYAKIKNNIVIKKKPWNYFLLDEIKSSYSNSNYFNKYFPKIKSIFLKEEDNLISLNMKLIIFFKQVFNIKTKIIMASELNLKPKNYVKSNASEDLINLCNRLNATTYLSGIGGKNYLDLKLFSKENINVKFQNFKHPIYKQNFPGFLENLSSIDLLFNTGKYMPS